jgi:hypothetical protein
MRSRLITGLLVVPVLALSACGGGGKSVDAATYTCGQFNKSLRTKGDNSSGNYINQLRKRAALNQDAKVERREITLGIFFACRGKPGSTRPADDAVKTAKALKAGTFKLPSKKKKSTD